MARAALGPRWSFSRASLGDQTAKPPFATTVFGNGAFQRGAVDGLNVVVPFAEPEYYRARPSIAIPRPTSPAGNPDAAIDLDGFFGLHPSLAPLKPLFDQQHLAIVDAVGSPDPTRSASFRRSES